MFLCAREVGHCGVTKVESRCDKQISVGDRVDNLRGFVVALAWFKSCWFKSFWVCESLGIRYTFLSAVVLAFGSSRFGSSRFGSSRFGFLKVLGVAF
jgi:hypothetical protein